MTRQQLEDYINALPNTKLEFPFGEDVAVYKTKVKDEYKMYALIPEKKQPLQVSLKCDPQLASVLRDRYESVMEGYHLNKRHWNTMVLSGQLTDQEVLDLVLHSYNLVIGNTDAIPHVAR